MDLGNRGHLDGNVHDTEWGRWCRSALDLDVIVHAIVVVEEGASLGRVRHHEVHHPGILWHLQSEENSELRCIARDHEHMHLMELVRIAALQAVTM